MNAIYGYHRVSTKEQHLDRGIAEIENYCKEKNITLTMDVFCDKSTGLTFDRPEYQFLKHRIQSDDTLILTELDRLGRSKESILYELTYFVEKGVRVIILEIPTTQMDLSGMENSMAQMIMETINKLLIEIYAMLAQAEMEKRKKRQKEGIASKKARGEWEDYGRPAALSMNRFIEEYSKVTTGEITGKMCQRNLNISHSTYYRYKKQADKKSSVGD